MVGFLGRKLAKSAGGREGGGGGQGGGVFCYVNSVFAPGLDEGVGGLWRVSGAFLFGGCWEGREGESKGWLRHVC